MAKTDHVFHTKHDFRPELAWSAFQILAGVQSDGISAQQLRDSAHLFASPLRKRADLSKIVSGMADVGLVDQRSNNKVSLSRLGKSLSDGMGRYQNGFLRAVHCLYSWRWIWEGKADLATPSWSYREVCRQLLKSGNQGMTADDAVLRVVSAAGRFNADRVSFSRLSVGGVTMWLAAQVPSLVLSKAGRLSYPASNELPHTQVQVHLASLCRLSGGQCALNSQNLQLLAECLLVPPDRALGLTIDFVRESSDFILIPGRPARAIFQESDDPFLTCIVNGP